MRRINLAGLVVALIISLSHLASLASVSERPPTRDVLATKSYEFTNGQWFDGNRFVPATFYSVAGHLTLRRPTKIDSVIDLKGQYVVPPFAEAHTHNIGRPPTQEELKPYIQQGIFYVMNQGNLISAGSIPASDPDSPVEVVYANGPLTPSGGHPVVLNERAVERGNLKLTKAELDGRAFFVVDDRSDLDRKWPAILAAKPDFIKVYLGFIEEYEKRKDDPNYIDKRGIGLPILREVVHRAHAAGLRVSAHIETAADFHACLIAGVDIIAHLPGLRIGAAAGFSDRSIDRWIISEEDAGLAAKKGTIVITTVIAGKKVINSKSEDYAPTREIYQRNIATLSNHRVRLVIGSDYYEGTALAEVFLLGHQPLLGDGIEPLGVFDNLTLLKMWTQTTPQAIFPGRKIGHLREGYEASFLVLSGNPLNDFANVRHITMRFKQGHALAD